MTDQPHTAENDAPVERCAGTCDYCRPDARHGCWMPEGHEGYHSCVGYVIPPGAGPAGASGPLNSGAACPIRKGLSRSEGGQ